MKLIDQEYSEILTETSLEFLFKNHPNLTKDLHEFLTKASELDHTAFVKCYNGYLFKDLKFQPLRFSPGNKAYSWFPTKLAFEGCSFWGIPFVSHDSNGMYRMPDDKSLIKIDWWRSQDRAKVKQVKNLYLDILQKYRLISNGVRSSFINDHHFSDLFEINLETVAKWEQDQPHQS
jgi:hypothetical protein